LAGYLKPEKVLITGGTGYLGSRIGQFLSECAYQVDLGSREPFKNGEVSNCRQIVTNWQDPELAFCKGYDLIIHAAGMNAKNCAESPDSAFNFNGLLTDRLVKQAVKDGCKKFFYLSTVHVYNSPLVGCFSESSEVLNSHPYATSHFCGEQALVKVLQTGEIRGAVLRLSNCFGPSVVNNKDDGDLVLNQFVRDAITRNLITIKGNYLARRDFLPISELNRIILEVLKYKYPLSNTINISSGKSRTLEEISNISAEMVLAITGEHVRIDKNKDPVHEGELMINNTALSEMSISVNSDLTQEIRELILGLLDER
jgi:UDP-glucose 4-epimerase